jgi:hypothetical protein
MGNLQMPFRSDANATTTTNAMHAFLDLDQFEGNLCDF